MQNKKSGNIYLRPLEKKDINKRYISWFADKKVTKFLESRNITEKESKSYLEAGVITGRYYLLAICYAVTDLHIGNIKIGPIRREDGVSDLVTVLGDKNYWGKGYGTETVKLMLHYIFSETDLNRIYLHTLSWNDRARKCFIT